MGEKKVNTVQLGSRVFEECILSPEEAQALIDEWQVTLSLQDWGVILEIVRQDDMPLKQSVGTMSWNAKKNIATLSLLDPQDYYGFTIPQDMEKTIVHELLHLALVPLHIKEKNETALEVFIEKVSSALVAAKRFKQ